MLKRLPLGIQTFEKIIDEDFLYVDKTRIIHRLLTTGDYFFLSRPRRFGKSVTLSTIKSIYQGQRDLFKGLWIEDQWDWSQTNPVIHISFSSVDYQGSGLEKGIKIMLNNQAIREHEITLDGNTIKTMFSELIWKLSERGKVVLLIDEYDKPIIDYLEETQKAKEHQSVLKTFYSVIKDSDPYIEFLLLTGVSKFSKVSIFSELNNLTDITLNRRFAALTGYTQSEVETYFGDYIAPLSDELETSSSNLLEGIRSHYNGYSWDGKTSIYNPYSVMSFLTNGDFRNFWFETGTPTFLLKLMRKDWLYKLDNLEVSEQTFSSYDIENLQPLAILFQTGYLTIKEKGDFGLYTLDYPNAEVKEALLSYIIGDLRQAEVAFTKPLVIDLMQAFRVNDLERVVALIKNIFRTIPNQIFLSKAEAYYHSLIHLVFYYMGQYIESEVNTSNGRLDSVVQSSTHIYILEFKLDKRADDALAQIKERGYAERYSHDPRPKVLVGINFSSAEKTIDDWVIEEVE